MDILSQSRVICHPDSLCADCRWTALFGCALGMTQLILITGLNEQWGIRNEYFVLGDSVILTVLGQVSFMPVLVLAARSCPEVGLSLLLTPAGSGLFCKGEATGWSLGSCPDCQLLAQWLRGPRGCFRRNCCMCMPALMLVNPRVSIIHADYCTSCQDLPGGLCEPARCFLLPTCSCQHVCRYGEQAIYCCITEPYIRP